MSRVCELTGKGRQVGQQCFPRQQQDEAHVPAQPAERHAHLGCARQSVKLRVSTHGLRSVEHVGGLDNWVLKTSDEKLSPKVRKLKKEIAKKVAEPACCLKSSKRLTFQEFS